MNLSKIKDSAVVKALAGLGDIFVNKPVEFGKQMGSDLRTIVETANMLAKAKTSPQLSYNPEGINNLIEQVKRAGTFGLGLSGASSPAAVGALSGGTGAIQTVLDKMNGSNTSDALLSGANTALSSVPNSLLAVGAGNALEKITPETIRIIETKLKGDKGLRTAKGSYTTADKYIKGTRAYFRRAVE